MQIDGESIKIKNLKSIKISKTNRINGHKLRVMINKNPIEWFDCESIRLFNGIYLKLIIKKFAFEFSW